MSLAKLHDAMLARLNEADMWRALIEIDGILAAASGRPCDSETA